MYQNEFSQEFEQAVGQEVGQEFSGETFEFNPEYLGETSAAAQGESYETSGELNETYEMELAHQLLEVSNEQELNQFLGGLIKSVSGAASGFAKSAAGKAIGGALKQVAKKALPLAGGALGGALGGPLGASVGSSLGSMASNLFELELEGLSPEDQEFETARAYMRFANAAVKQTMQAQQRRPGGPMSTAVRQGLAKAAMQHAPGLLRPRNPDGTFRAARRPQPGSRRSAQLPMQARAYGLGAAPATAPGYGPPAAPSYGPAPVMAYQGAGYPPPTGYQFDGPEPDQDAGYEPMPSSDYQPADEQFGGYTPKRGSWQRRGRTLIIQL